MGNTVNGQTVSFYVNDATGNTLIGSVVSHNGKRSVSYTISKINGSPISGNYSGHEGYSINRVNGTLRFNLILIFQLIFHLNQIQVRMLR